MYPLRQESRAGYLSAGPRGNPWRRGGTGGIPHRRGRRSVSQLLTHSAGCWPQSVAAWSDPSSVKHAWRADGNRIEHHSQRSAALHQRLRATSTVLPPYPLDLSRPLDGDGVDAVGYGDSGLCSSEWLLGGVVQRMHSGNLSPTAELLECCGCHAYRGDFATAPVKPLNVRTKT